MEWTTNPDLWGPVPASSNPRWNAVRIVPGSTGYRLPTEAQWEFACRAGTITPWNTGNTITQSQANFYQTGGANLNRTTAVNSYAPNAWGLYNMHGNVWEWVWDWFGAYTADAKTNPTGPPTGVDRVLRGGCWFNVAEHLRSALRTDDTPSSRWNINGFRLVRP
ncbi:MAG: formylglycine-generating enzyme family protein [Spirochaetes bacterium]|nr:formylglycine-generating enzyme family protein [Spirochaetota bacterium]